MAADRSPSASSTAAGGAWFASGRITPGQGKAITTLVGVDLSGVTAPQVLISGNDFYSTPRLSSDGKRMSWLTWRHPDMPWVATEAWVGDILADGTIGSARRVAGYPFASARRPTLLATVVDDHEPIAFLTTKPNAIVAPIHAKASR
jgi:hypothetical protein